MEYTEGERNWLEVLLAVKLILFEASELKLALAVVELAEAELVDVLTPESDTVKLSNWFFCEALIALN
jgi:hypothetical protein